ASKPSGVGARDLGLRSPLPIPLRDLVQARLPPRFEPRASRQRRRGGDGAAARAGIDASPGMARVAVPRGERLAHPAAGLGQLGVDRAAEPILPAELGLPVT